MFVLSLPVDVTNTNAKFDLGNYYIPPVIFNVQTIKTEEGGERFLRISIDGKQRLSSIREFVNGNIPCTDKHGRKW